MKLSISNGVFCHLSLEDNLRAVYEMGFENLEFNMKSVEENDEESVFLAKKLIDRYGLECLTLHAATWPVENANEIPRAIYYGRVSLDFAHVLSVPVIVVHSNVSRSLSSELRAKFMQIIFKDLISYSKEMGIKLALENLSFSSNSYGKSVSELNEVVGIVNGEEQLGFTLDFCHGETSENTFDLLNQYGRNVLNVHMSGKAHAPLLSSDANLERFLVELAEFGYDGPITIELCPKSSKEDVMQTKMILEKLIDRI